MRRIFPALLALALLTSQAVFAVRTQAGSTPAGGAQASASDSAPVDYSGMYTFLRDGEFVQLTLEEKGKVSGFISRYGDSDSDRGAFLDQFFKQGTRDGQKLSFTTETVHGVWFEFQGTADRGPGKTANDEGYYVLKGTLTQHSTDANHKDEARSRQVVFKSFPQDVSAPASRPKD
ncbi:MAG TPA: hypothetical protein VLC12_14035 [Terriglobales bacterium]|nr:hypothetical protein [Terriglobales bacterium]